MQAELRNGIITGYIITYQSETENNNGRVEAGANVRQVNLTGLKEFVKYTISVFASTVKGIGPPSLLDVRTDQDSKFYNTFFSLLLLQSVSAFVYLFVCFFGLVHRCLGRRHDLIYTVIYRCLCANHKHIFKYDRRSCSSNENTRPFNQSELPSASVSKRS